MPPRPDWHCEARPWLVGLKSSNMDGITLQTSSNYGWDVGITVKLPLKQLGIPAWHSPPCDGLSSSPLAKCSDLSIWPSKKRTFPKHPKTKTLTMSKPKYMFHHFPHKSERFDHHNILCIASMDPAFILFHFQIPYPSGCPSFDDWNMLKMSAVSLSFIWWLEHVMSAVTRIPHMLRQAHVVAAHIALTIGVGDLSRLSTRTKHSTPLRIWSHWGWFKISEFSRNQLIEWAPASRWSSHPSRCQRGTVVSCAQGPGSFWQDDSRRALGNVCQNIIIVVTMLMV